jgi:two-component system response regulator VicR
MTRVLVIDDEIQVARALRRLLVRSGFEVALAHSAADGLARFAELAPAVVISDYYMPDRNGYELVREVMRRAPATVAFLLSGSLEVSSDAARLCDVIWKPWSEPHLIGLIRQRLAERGVS